MLYASQGREADARKALADLVRELDTPEAYFAAIRTYEILGDPQARRRVCESEARRLFPEARSARRRELSGGSARG